MTHHAGEGAQRLVEHLGLEAHPEGGWYRRTWTAPPTDAVGAEQRSAGSSILYLLESGVSSRWHRIDAVELWQHAAGAPLELARWAGGDGTVRSGPVRHDTLGPDLLDGQVPQCVVESGVWQSARSLGAWSLMTCVVVPAFRFEGFELAPPGWAPPGDRGQS